MKKAMRRTAVFLVAAAWTLARLLAVVWAVEFVAAYLKKED